MDEINPIATSQPQEPEEPQVYPPVAISPEYQQIDEAALAAFNARFDALAPVFNALCGLVSAASEMMVFEREYQTGFVRPIDRMAYPAKAGDSHGSLPSTVNDALASKLGSDYRLALEWIGNGGTAGVAWANLKYQPITNLIKTVQEFALQVELKMRDMGHMDDNPLPFLLLMVFSDAMEKQGDGTTCEEALRRVALHSFTQLMRQQMAGSLKAEFITNPAEVCDLFVGLLQEVGDDFKIALDKFVALTEPRLTNALNFVMSSQFEQSQLTYFRANDTMSVPDLRAVYSSKIAGVENVLTGRAEGELVSGLDDFREGCREIVQIIQHVLSSINELGVALATTRAAYTPTPLFEQTVSMTNKILSVVSSVLDSMLAGSYMTFVDESGAPVNFYPSGEPVVGDTIPQDVTDLSNSLQTNAPTNELVNSSSRINVSTEQVVDTGALKTSTTATALSVQTDTSLAPAATKATKDMSATALVVVGLLLLSILGGDKKR